MRIGAHVSIARGFPSVFDNIKSIGGNCAQIFSHSPRSWKFKDVQKAEEFRERYKKEDVSPIVIHNSYLVNLASLDKELHRKSMENMRKEFETAEILGVNYVNIHPGSNKDVKIGLNRIVESLNDIETKAYLLLENTASGIGSEFERLRYITENITIKCGVTLDTCHTYAAGYDIVSNLDNVLDEFDSIMGLEKLKLIHLNDSKFELGSKRDRHEHIGLGKIGMEGFRNFINHPKLRDIPEILETPVDKRRGFKENIEIVKGLVE
ncbi:MAG: deoxyribonuclease IV [Methanomicrobia archaeon]|nr:deoxyribonuclease IV [Methanomicrobia archaeon]